MEEDVSVSTKGGNWSHGYVYQSVNILITFIPGHSFKLTVTVLSH